MSTSESDDPRAWVRVAGFVRAQIEDGTIASSGFVPSITILAAQFGYSRGTCRKALQVLEAEHLLRRAPGLGYYVARADNAE